MSKAYKDARRIVYGKEKEVTVKGDEQYLNRVRDSLYKIKKRGRGKLVTTKKIKGGMIVWLN